MKRDFAVAVKAVIIKENKALVLCRSKHEMECSYMNSHQKWDLPGGGLHFFEKAEEGLRREIREETDLHVSIGPPLSLFDAIKHHIQWGNSLSSISSSVIQKEKGLRIGQKM